MTVTVTVVAFLIHLYSRGYMEHEGGYCLPGFSLT